MPTLLFIPILVYATPVYAPQVICNPYTTFTEYHDPDTLNAMWNERKSERWAHVTRVAGFAQRNTVTCVCNVHLRIPDEPITAEQLEAKGHEARHCERGAFHQ